MDHLALAVADQLVDLVSGHPASGRVHEGDDALAVDAQDAFAGTVEDRLVLLQQLFGPDAIGLRDDLGPPHPVWITRTKDPDQQRQRRHDRDDPLVARVDAGLQRAAPRRDRASQEVRQLVEVVAELVGLRPRRVLASLAT